LAENQARKIMRKPIQDEYTTLPISRQRKYQLRMQRDHRCSECGEPAAQGSRCVKHLVKARERQRKKRGLKRRYYNTLSYKLQAAA
jgi:formylmethanofuran dehydrogenase subunit E